MSEGSNGNAFEIIQNYSKCLGSERIDAFRDGEDGMNNKSSQVKSVVSTLGVVEIASSGKSDISGMSIMINFGYFDKITFSIRFQVYNLLLTFQ